MLNETERETHELRIEMRKLLEPVTKDLIAIKEEVTSLGNTVAAQAPANYAGISNYLDNSLPEWSKDAYAAPGVLPGTVINGNLECHNFYRQLAADTDLLKTDAERLKAAGHTAFEASADVPKWDKVNGTMSLGGAAARWDIYCPLPNDIVFPGQTFYFQLEAMLADPEDPISDTVQFYAGLYDDTGDIVGPPAFTAQQKFIEGGAFTITGEIFGPDGDGSTPAEYQIVAKTDSGEEAISNIVPLPLAPAVFSGSNHPRIYFAGVAGFIQFLIYRKRGSEFVHQYTVGNTIEGSYFDVGNPPIAIVSGWPSVTETKPRAYAETVNFTPGAAIWVRHGFTIFVPTTYDRSKTAPGMQYLRFGLTGLTDVGGQVLIRRLGLSQGDGTWARSPNDMRTGVHSTPSTSATGSGGGSADGGGGVDPPAPPGGGDPPIYCVLVNSLIGIAGGGEIPLERLDREFLDSGGAVHGRVRKLSMSHASRVYRIRTERGCEVGCSAPHGLITHSEDYKGTPAKRLKKRFDVGEAVFTLTMLDGIVAEDRIVKMDEEFGDFLVGSPHMDGCHFYIANGFLSHNAKPEGGYGPI